MDLHIYDMKLNPEDVVIMSGTITQDEMPSFSGYMKVIQHIFPNPVIYVPSDATIDALPRNSIKELLKDALKIESLDALSSIASEAFSEKYDELQEEHVEEETADEV